MTLVEVEDCVFDAEQLSLSRGYEALDLVAREAFVNHIHINTGDRAEAAERVIEMWATEMRARWPDRVFRIYRQVEPDEITIRFHMVRAGLLDWCDSGIEVITICGP